MTLSVTNRLKRYTGNDATTEWPYDFLIPDAASLRVFIYDTITQVRTELNTSQYSVTGLGEDTFGAVTYPLAGDPLDTDTQIIIVRDVANTQPTNLTNQSAYLPEVLEDALDRIVMQVQQLAEQVARAIYLPEGDEFDDNLPAKSELADKYLLFDGDGNPTVGEFASLGVITVPVGISQGGSGATTAAGARTAFGLAIGSDVQAYSATLTAFGALATAANKGFYATGAGVVAEFDLTAAARGLLDDATVAAMRATLGLPKTFEPGGRLTLTSGVPVLASDVTAASTVYYTPYKHNSIAIYDGTNWIPNSFSELSQTLADTTKSPGAAAADSLYDLFVWDDSGTLRCTRGPAWSSATARGTGSGTTELERLDGVLVNKFAITNGPAAQRGVYVGTIATNGSTQLAMNMAPSAAAGGNGNRLDVWNMYNRVGVSAVSRDSTNSWTYTTATIRAANNSTSNRVTFVRGLDEEAVDARYNALAASDSSGRNEAWCGIGLDVTNALAAGAANGSMAIGSDDVRSIASFYKGKPGLGRHFLQALEHSEAADTTTWYGDNNNSRYQMALQVSVLM